MKHLDPIQLAELADDARSNSALREHLRACPQCREEWQSLRSLAALIAKTPKPPKDLHGRTLARLGLRPPAPTGAWGWGLTATALVAALVFYIQMPTIIPSPSVAPGVSPATQPLTQTLTDKAGTLKADRRAPIVALRHAEPKATPEMVESQPVAPITSSPAVGNVTPMLPETAKVQGPHRVGGETPGSPAPMLSVTVRGNWVRDGQPLRIELGLPSEGRLQALVFDPRGRLVERLYDATVPPGDLELRWNADNAPSGAYNILLRFGGQQKSVHCIVIR